MISLVIAQYIALYPAEHGAGAANKYALAAEEVVREGAELRTSTKRKQFPDVAVTDGTAANAVSKLIV